MGLWHQSDHTCIAVIEHTATYIKSSLISALKSNDSFVSLIVDKRSNFAKSYIIFYLRGDVTGREDIENIFLNLVEIDKGTTAEALYQALKKPFWQQVWTMNI